MTSFTLSINNRVDLMGCSISNIFLNLFQIMKNYTLDKMNL
jgi:hypothetical protein